MFKIVMVIVIIPACHAQYRSHHHPEWNNKQTHHPILKYTIIRKAAWSQENGEECGLLSGDSSLRGPGKPSQELPADGHGREGGWREPAVRSPPCPSHNGHHEQVLSGYVTEASRTSFSPQAVWTGLPDDGEKLHPSSPGQLLASKWQDLIQ